jgi:hypothetical protein
MIMMKMVGLMLLMIALTMTECPGGQWLDAMI